MPFGDGIAAAGSTLLLPDVKTLAAASGSNSDPAALPRSEGGSLLIVAGTDLQLCDAEVRPRPLLLGPERAPAKDAGDGFQPFP